MLSPFHFRRLVCVLALAGLFVLGLAPGARAQAPTLGISNVILTNITTDDRLDNGFQYVSSVFFKGNFYAITNDGRIAISANGTVWNYSGAIGGVGTILETVASPSLIVAVGSADTGTIDTVRGNSTATQGEVWTSPDAVNWTAADLPGSSTTIFSVTWSGNCFVAVGQDDQVFVSPSGTNWFKLTLGQIDGPTASDPAANLTLSQAEAAQALNPGLAINSGGDGGYTLSNATSIYLQNPNTGLYEVAPNYLDPATTPAYGASLHDVTFTKTATGGIYMAVGSSGTIVTCTLTNEDLAQGKLPALWQVHYQPPISAGSIILTYVAANSTLAMATGFTNKYMLSADGGNSWTTATLPTNLDTVLGVKVRYFDGKFIAFSSSGIIASTTDGITWTTDHTFAVQENDLAANSDDSVFVSVGYGNKVSELGVSNNLSTWSAFDFNLTGTYSAIATDLTGNLVVEAGDSRDSATQQSMLLSEDGGQTWTGGLYNYAEIINEGPPLGNVTFPLGVAYALTGLCETYAPALGMFMVSGAEKQGDNNTPGPYPGANKASEVPVIFSQDGVNWLYTDTNQVNNINGLAYDPVANEAIAVGDNGALLVLPAADIEGLDAIWTQIPPATVTLGNKNNLTGIATNGATWVVVAEGGLMATTTADGAVNSWVINIFDSNLNFRSVAYGNGIYVAVGDGGLTFTSPDGLVWTSQLTSITANLLHVAYTDGLWIATADDTNIYMSLDATGWVTTPGPAPSVTVAGTGGTAAGFVVFGPDSNAIDLTTLTYLVTLPTGTAIPNVEVVQPPVTEQGVYGNSITFTALGSSSGWQVYYQWYFNGVALVDGVNGVSGATTSTLTVSPLRTATIGQYSVVISNGLKNVASASAELVLHYPPTITVQPRRQLVANGAHSIFTVGVSGNGPFRYSWYWNATVPFNKKLGQPLVNNSIISGVHTSKLVINSGNPKRNGYYTVVVTSPYGTVSSTPAKLTILKAR